MSVLKIMIMLNINLIDAKYDKSFFNQYLNRYLLKQYENISSIIETIRTHYRRGITRQS